MATECLEKPGVDADVDRQVRWRVCVHESAHIVAARRLTGCSAGAAVFTNGSGVADIGSEGGVPKSFKEALATAAGPAAEAIADQHPVPQVELPVPLEVTYPEAAGRLKAGVMTIMTDHVALARWAIENRETEPEMWAKRHGWVMDAAEEFVLEHWEEIVEVATALFGRGMVRLPAEPEKGLEHVD